MKQLVVLSGKGGTGKTVVTAAFAALAPRPVLADCDVDRAACTGCGECVERCAFGALALDAEGKAAVDPVACEGCSLCAHVCPVEAIAMRPVVAGQWFVSDTSYGPLVHARLGVAQENSGKLVTLVRNRALEIATEREAPWLLVDGSPGIGCPVIASLAGADAVLIVAEPTLSGLSDMRRVAQLAAHFDVPAFACVNKWDLNGALARQIEGDCAADGARALGRVPYDPAVPRSVVAGRPLVEFDDGPAAQAVRDLWAAVRQALESEPGETEGSG